MEGMDSLREAVDAAFDQYRQGLIQLIIRSLTSLAAKDPQATYEYSAGMGIWYFKRTGPVTEEGETYIQEDGDIEPEPAFEALQDAESDYGNQAIPQGDFEIKGKKVGINNLG